MSGEPSGHVTWATTQVDNRCASRVFLNEGTEQGPVERLVDEFVTQLRRVSLCEHVVAATDLSAVRTVSHHNRMSPHHVFLPPT